MTSQFDFRPYLAAALLGGLFGMSLGSMQSDHERDKALTASQLSDAIAVLSTACSEFDLSGIGMKADYRPASRQVAMVNEMCGSVDAGTRLVSGSAIQHPGIDGTRLVRPLEYRGTL